MGNPKIKRVLVSVADKTGIVDFARALVEDFSVQIIATSGTARFLENAGVPVTPIDDITKFPEMLDGRIKTLHPLVHGGLLAKRDDQTHMMQASEQGIEMIDMAVVNLRGFHGEQSVDEDFITGIDSIDIGGSTLIRSAAKNHEFVAVVTNPSTYNDVLAELRANGGATTLDTRRVLALEAFRATGAYDTAVSRWLANQIKGYEDFPQKMDIQLTKKQDLRYGENPHQTAALYSRGTASEHSLVNAEQLGGKPLSFNNLLDADACWAIVRELSDPAVVFLKHQNPCGSAEAASILEAFERAYACDTKSAFGGTVAANRTVTTAIAQRIIDDKLYLEAIIAPDFEAEALELLKQKKDLRILATHGIDAPVAEFEYRTVDGGVVVQDIDRVSESPSAFTVPTKRKPTSKEMEDLLFAWKVVKGVKSNAVLIAKDRTGIGLGPGQPNRVDACIIACRRAGDACKGAVAASDAFFPFRDNVDVLASYGVTAIIQPGGSIRDDESIAACDAHGIAMVFTSYRHFRY